MILKQLSLHHEALRLAAKGHTLTEIRKLLRPLADEKRRYREARRRLAHRETCEDCGFYHPCRDGCRANNINIIKLKDCPHGKW